jgi:NADPH:quinone reductase-like Zn-dependent oxidoreductase
MKAWLAPAYGPPDVLRCEEVLTPRPGPGEVRIRVRATTVRSADVRIRGLALPRGFGLLGRPALGFRGPRQPILGTELAGEVEAVGPGAARFQVGDRVYAFPGGALGGHAEYRCLKEDRVSPLPPALGFEEGAGLCFGGTTALHYLRRAGLARGERVLVNGAAGAVGLALVQLARLAGAHVTAVCRGANVDLVRTHGAHEVVDHTQQDFASLGATWDVVADPAGTAPFRRVAPVLRAGGRLLAIAADLPAMLAAPWHSAVSGRQVVAGPAAERADDIAALGALAAEGQVRPWVDRVFPFEAMREAHAFVERGGKRGSVVVRLEV